MVILDIVLFLIVLGVNIAVHEYAHFYFAKKADILCHEYAIGMGPAIYEKKKGETLYAIRAIPLGGYVSMAGEEVGDFVKVDNTIGIRINEEGFVSHIILNNSSEYDFIGKVKDFDLYGKDNKELFVKLNVSGEIKEYLVLRDAMYVLSEKKEIQVAPAERSFENKTLWERFLVVFAGPASNFLLAFFVLLFVGFFIGKPVNDNVIKTSLNNELKSGDVISSINGVDISSFSDLSREIYLSNKSKVTLVLNETETKTIDLGISFQGLGFANMKEDGSLSEELVVGQTFGRKKDLLINDKIIGIHLGDELTNYNEVINWDELISYSVLNKDAKNVFLKVLRDDKEVELKYENINSETIEKLGAPYIGYSLGITGNTKFNFFYSIAYPFRKVGSDMKNMAQTIGLLFNPKSGVGAKDLAGPIGIFSLVKDAKSGGVISFLTFFSFLSINIGFLNLLPIPALDGGRLIFIGYEAITKKKVNKKFENALITVTFVLLLALMLFVTFNDALRLFN